MFITNEIIDGFKFKKSYEKIGEICEAEMSFRYFKDKDFTNLGKKDIAYNYVSENLNFSGEIKYSFNIKNEKNLLIQFYGEKLTAYVGDKKATSIVSPMLLKIPSECKIVNLVVSNTLANAMKDSFSCYSTIELCGINKIEVLK